MEKNARVETGKTPSIHSGRPSETEKDGESVCEDELEKKSSIIDATITNIPSDLAEYINKQCKNSE